MGQKMADTHTPKKVFLFQKVLLPARENYSFSAWGKERQIRSETRFFREVIWTDFWTIRIYITILSSVYVLYSTVGFAQMCSFRWNTKHVFGSKKKKRPKKPSQDRSPLRRSLPCCSWWGCGRRRIARRRWRRSWTRSRWGRSPEEGTVRGGTGWSAIKK